MKLDLLFTSIKFANVIRMYIGKSIKDAGEGEGGDISGWGFMHKINVINMELARTDKQFSYRITHSEVPCNCFFYITIDLFHRLYIYVSVNVD